MHRYLDIDLNMTQSEKFDADYTKYLVYFNTCNASYARP